MSTHLVPTKIIYPPSLNTHTSFSGSIGYIKTTSWVRLLLEREGEKETLTPHHRLSLGTFPVESHLTSRSITYNGSTLCTWHKIKSWSSFKNVPSDKISNRYRKLQYKLSYLSCHMITGGSCGCTLACWNNTLKQVPYHTSAGVKIIYLYKF